MPREALLVGCGDLGAGIGHRLVALGHDVLAIRRRADLVPAPLRRLAADLTRETPVLPPLDLGLLVVALSARPRTEEAYRATYVDGMARALDAVEAAGAMPERAVLVSSTGVYGDLLPEPLVDESTPTTPADGPARMLLAAEELFAQRVAGGTIVRPSGLYRGAGGHLAEQVRSGRITDPHRWTNRVHRDDVAAAVVHLLTMPEHPERLYVATDDEPAQLGDVAAFLASRLDAPEPPAADPAQGHGKRLSNTRLRASGWVPEYPTYREGYGA